MQLNKWLGSDKPKKDDFNSDNQKIDEACRLISQSVEQLEYAQQNNSYATTQTLGAHTGNSSIHVTAAEKTSWSQGASLVTGYYTGNGDASQRVTLGFQPKFGLIFAVNEGICRYAPVYEQLQTYCGCMTPLGCSSGIALNTDGFTVSHSGMGVDTFAIKFNATSVRYVYFIWK